MIDFHFDGYIDFKYTFKHLALEVYQFDLDNTEIKNPKREFNFHTSEIEIAYATARTLCSYHIDQEEYYYDIIASLFTHFNFINSSGSYLKLKKERYERLRDFSKTARVGELAQGINYLFVQERLKYPFIIDYHLFCKKNGIRVTGKTPDFVVLSNDLKQIGLFESKGNGTNANKVIERLKSAITQLTSAKSIAATKLIPVCARFEKGRKNSSINYLNLNNHCVKTEKLANLNFKAFKQHYASWFYLVGDFTRAIQLLSKGDVKGENTEDSNNAFTTLENDPNYDGETNKDIYWVTRPFNFRMINDNPSFQIWAYTLLTNRHFFKIGIYKSVVESLLKPELEVLPEFNIEKNNEILIFADGTILKFGEKYEEIKNQ
jgi:hypothetical protein